MALLNSLKRSLYPVYRQYFSRAYLYEGMLKSGNGSVKCLFIDNDRFYLQVLPKLFTGAPALVRNFRCWIPGLKRMMDEPGLDADICFANVPLRYAPHLNEFATFKMQTRVTQTLEVATDLESNKCFRGRRRDENRIIRKYGLSCRISHDKDDFDLFYHRMFQPLIRKFGEAAMDTTYEEMRPVFEKGLIMFVIFEGSPVAGVLFYWDKGVITAYRSGLLDGEQSPQHMAAMSAWYFFLIEYARQQGFHKVDFMRSLPFLNDGIYQHKQHWGAKTEPYADAPTWVYLFNRSVSEKFAKIMENIPLIVHTGNGLEGVVSLPEEQALTPVFEEKLFRQYAAPGITGLQIVRRNSPGEHVAWLNNC